MINVSFEALFGKDVIPNFENRYNLTILCNHHFTIIFNTTHSKPFISPNLRTLQIRNSHARLSGSYNTKHCQDNTICLLAKKKNLLCDVTNVYVSHRVSRTSECIFFHGCHNDDIWVNSRWWCDPLLLFPFDRNPNLGRPLSASIMGSRL